VDARSDVYALGLVVWYLVTGKPPYAAEALGEILHQQMNEPLPAASKAREGLPPDLDAALARICAKDPQDRPASMDEVVRLLEALQPRELHLAPLMTRVVAASLDFASAFMVAMITGFAALGLAALLGDYIGAGAAKFIGNLLAAIVGAASTAGLLLVPELWWGTTVGKYLFGLRVLRADGTRPSLVALFVRLLLRYPLLPFGVLGVVVEGSFWLVGLGLQAVAVGVGIVFYFLKDGLTLSDVVTRTRVAYALGDPRSSASAAS
jgi:uncharacterized RDD family membrane protein YckC